jgi:hypothetical protein
MRRALGLALLTFAFGHALAAPTHHAKQPVAPFPACNAGPTHHSHLIIPLEATEEACAASDARFFLSHGATFFCPHTWDVKLLAQIAEDDARATLCKSFFSAVPSLLPSPHLRTRAHKRPQIRWYPTTEGLNSTHSTLDQNHFWCCRACLSLSS